MNSSCKYKIINLQHKKQYKMRAEKFIKNVLRNSNYKVINQESMKMN